MSTEAARRDRVDIQALRALAVGGVVLFHMWPQAIPGGYVGVDVFFVISGFLITSHLLREVGRSGTISLATFWARRIRRLLPAAYVVLLATMAGVWAFVPRGLWEINFREIISSALYFENWKLAANSVDYLNAEDAPSAVQHYWSLAVEEQFYVIWPLLLLVLGWGAARGVASRRRLLLGALSVIVIASFIASVVTTIEAPGPAYFVTWTRVWEFGLGALVATVALTVPTKLAGPVRLLGWVGLIVAILLYDESTPFPGWTAALPALATVFVIAAGDAPAHSIATKIGGLWPVQQAGTLSYSLYLWHWPVLIIGGYVTAQADTTTGRAVVLAISIAASYLTYYLVENPLRHQRWLAAVPARSLVAGLAVGVAIAGVAHVGVERTVAAEKASIREATALLASGVSCFGADAALNSSQPCDNPELANVLVPRITARLNDTGGAYKCYDATPDSTLKTCQLGSNAPGAFRVALVGDSHGASLLPGITDRLDELGWHLDTYVGRGCVWGRDEAACPEQTAAVEKRLMTGKPYDLVITTMVRHSEQDPARSAEVIDGLAQAWNRVAARGTQVVALADNPTLPDSTLRCMESAHDAAELKGCTMTPQEAWQVEDPLPAAVTKAANRRVSLVDLSAAYCTESECPLVIGHVIVYRDQHHITATYSRTLAPYLVQGIQRAVVEQK